jgi:hypothetical protein
MDAPPISTVRAAKLERGGAIGDLTPKNVAATSPSAGNEFPEDGLKVADILGGEGIVGSE